MNLKIFHIFRYIVLLLLLLASFIDAVQSTTTCNSFPKILGGKVDTYLWQIDAFDDYLAIAGDTWDKTLADLSTSSRLPYLHL